MAGKRVLVVDGYNVIKILRDFDVSFEEIAALGCHIEGESELKLTPALIAVWYEEEKKSGKPAHLKGQSPDRKTSNYCARVDAFSARSDRTRSMSSTVTRLMIGNFRTRLFSRVYEKSTLESACHARAASSAFPVARIASTRSCRLSISEVITKF